MILKQRVVQVVLFNSNKKGNRVSNLRLNDIWRKVDTEVLFFTEETFQNVPKYPGVYAWFYPLRIVTKDLNEFIKEVEIMLDYDWKTKGIPERETNIEFSWERINQKTEVQRKKINLDKFKSMWNQIENDEHKFDEFRKIIMRSSILLSPLYVGKAENLYIRCQQHINGNSTENSFHNRFEDYAKKNNATANKVSDLIFVTLKTGEDPNIGVQTEKLVEEILKCLVKPKYSII